MNSDGLLHPQLWHPLYLSTDEVHIWCVSLDRSPQILSKLKSLLSPTELARASRFHFEKDRNHFIVSHGLLRSILGGYLGLEPSQIQFRYGPYGKPLVDIFHQEQMLQFSLSHSNNLALYAVTWNRLLGVDIEHIRPIPEAICIAEQFFSPNENIIMRSLPLEQRQDAFFHIWTCKEAYLKARGYGITKSLAEFEISVLPGDLAQLVSIRGSPCDADIWQLEIFRSFAGYWAALAVQGYGWCSKIWHLVE